MSSTLGSGGPPAGKERKRERCAGRRSKRGERDREELTSGGCCWSRWSAYAWDGWRNHVMSCHHECNLCTWEYNKVGSLPITCVCLCWCFNLVLFYLYSLLWGMDWLTTETNYCTVLNENSPVTINHYSYF